MGRLPKGARRRGRLTATGCLLGLVLGGTPVHSETGLKKPPHRSQPARAAQSAPDRTGSLAKAAARMEARTAIAAPRGPVAILPAPEPADGGVLAPTTLPSAPRSRMLVCGKSWHAMKMSGSVGDENWRDYAFKCLTEKDTPTH